MVLAAPQEQLTFQTGTRYNLISYPAEAVDLTREEIIKLTSLSSCAG